MDPNGDGLADPDVNEDGVLNAHDLDSDGDAYPDADEGEADLDRDDIPDYVDYTGDFVGGGCSGGRAGLLGLPWLVLSLWRRRR